MRMKVMVLMKMMTRHVDPNSVQKIPVKNDRRHSRQHLHESVGMHLKEEQELSGAHLLLSGVSPDFCQKVVVGGIENFAPSIFL